MTSKYVKGKKRRLVTAVRDAASDVLITENYAEAYFAYLKLGAAVQELDNELFKLKREVA